MVSFYPWSPKVEPWVNRWTFYPWSPKVEPWVNRWTFSSPSPFPSPSSHHQICQRPLTKTWFQRPLTIETENGVGGGCVGASQRKTHAPRRFLYLRGKFLVVWRRRRRRRRRRKILLLLLHTTKFLFLLGTENTNLYCTVLYVLYCMYCTVLYVLYCMYCMYCTVCTVLYVLYCMYCTVCTVLYVLYCSSSFSFFSFSSEVQRDMLPEWSPTFKWALLPACLPL